MDPEDKLIGGDTNISLENIVEGEISAVDLGSKDVDFDELIIFTHTYLNYRKCECITKDIEPFSVLLTNNEFLMLSSTIIEENSLSNKEIVPIVRKKVIDYSGYEPAQKTNFLEAMPSYAKEIGFELTVDLFFPILLKIINDIIQKKKNDDKIMKLCSDALLDVVKFIRDEDKGQSILTIIITLANNDDDKEKDRCKTIAAQLQNDLAPFIGQESCEMWIVPQISSFAEDHAHGVRKSVLKNFMKICETVSHDCFIHRLLPIYEKLAKDSLWTVRKPAVEILPLLTKLCDSNTISKVLLPLYKAFESDSKNYVKHSAVEIFGQFITLLSPNDRSEDLLEYYINIVHDINSKDQEDLSIACHCAYNFPAVLFAYGKEQWDKLKPCFDKFALENNEKIKGPIASALGEIANIVGPKITERDILPYVNKFYNDNKLQSRILIVLPDIVRNVSSSKKLYYLEYLKAMIPSKEKWRKRMEHAKIICKFHQIYSDDILYKRVFPIAVNICFDNVAKVRFKAAKFISKMFLQLLSSETEYKSKTFMILLCFAQSINFNYRQLFIRMCQDLYSNEKLITDEIIDYIYDLAYDNVLNVRITLAKSLAKILKENKFSWIKENEKMVQIINALSQDKSKIVADLIKNNDVKKIDLVPIENPNKKFTNLMELITKEFGITNNIPKDSKVQLFATNKTILFTLSNQGTSTFAVPQTKPKPVQAQPPSNLAEKEPEENQGKEKAKDNSSDEGSIINNIDLNSSEEEPLKKDEDKVKEDKTE